ncbi:MAG: hypothetical protein ABI205_11575 [Gemmatimonadaceae bacterium]
MSAVRTLQQEEAQWRIYEVSTKSVPGAVAGSCLIYDSEAIVRRCWVYPADWYGLSDAALWALLVAQVVRRSASTHPAMIAAAETIATAQALASEARSLLGANRALRMQRDQLLTSCRESRNALLAAIGHYTASLKHSGASPELALVLVKEAIRDGLGGEAKCEEAAAAALFGDGITHAIKTYYAA